MKQIITRRRADTRERLLEAAFQVFAEQGFTGASIEMIGEAAGFTRGAYYSNFSSKEELFMALVSREIDLRLRSLVAAVGNLDLTGTDGLIASSADVRGVIGEIMTNSSQERNWHIMVNEFELFALRNPDRGRPYMMAYESYMMQIAQELLPLLQQLGLRFVVDPQVGGRLLITGYLEASRQAYLRDDKDFEAAIEEQMEGFMVLVDRLVESISQDGCNG